MTYAVLAHDTFVDTAVMCESCERALASYLVGDKADIVADDAPIFLVCAACLPVDA